VLPIVEREGNIGDGKSGGEYDVGCIGDGEYDVAIEAIGWAEASAGSAFGDGMGAWGGG